MDVRETLVELIAQKVCDTWSESCDEWLTHDCGKCYANDCHISEVADHLISNGVTVQDWVSVKDRLPDEHESLFARYKGTDKWRNAMFTTISDRVIVCAEYENGVRIVKTANTVDGVWKVKNIFRQCKVTHWMPLPHPPKGE